MKSTTMEKGWGLGFASWSRESQIDLIQLGLDFINQSMVYQFRVIELRVVRHIMLNGLPLYLSTFSGIN
ncbi:hypothetical protein ACOSQ4_027446 [Xanthoceras sorbifolium]